MKEGKAFHISQNEVLYAYKAVKANKGAGGVDGVELEELSEYIASSGKHYKNHLATLRSWARRDKPKTASYSHSNYTCAEGDSL